MGTTSTVPDVCEALLDALAAAMPSGVRVSDGPLTNGEKVRELVTIGDVEMDVEVPTMKAGRASRNEAYRVQVVMTVAQARGKTAAARRRVFVLAAVLEEILASDKECAAVDEVAWWKHSRTDHGVEMGNEGPLAWAVLTVAVNARLQGDS